MHLAIMALNYPMGNRQLSGGVLLLCTELFSCAQSCFAQRQDNSRGGRRSVLVVDETSNPSFEPKVFLSKR